MVATARVSAVAPSHSARASSSVTGDRQNAITLDRILKGMSVEFREEPCRSALNRLQGMPFKWSLNPYMGCAHRCTFCYVRGFERRAATRAEGHVTFSVPTLDTEIWRRTEPGTAPPRQRLRALRMLIDAGIDAGVGIAPVLPGISDRPELLADVVRAARDAGATNVWCNVLYLQPGTREHFMEHLARDWPELVPSYLALYRRPYPGRATTEPVKGTVAALKKRFGVADRRVRPLEPSPAAEQLALAI